MDKKSSKPLDTGQSKRRSSRWSSSLKWLKKIWSLLLAVLKVVKPIIEIIQLFTSDDS